ILQNHDTNATPTRHIPGKLKMIFMKTYPALNSRFASAFGFRPSFVIRHSSFVIPFCFLLSAFCFLRAASAATTNLSAALQQALFEEEANHNLTAAIQSYQSLITQFDQDRKLAATAVF